MMVRSNIKKFLSDGSLNPRFLAELQRITLIQSTASSLRLAGIKITEKEVERIVGNSVTSSISQKNMEMILSHKQLSVWEYLQKINETTTGEIVEKTAIARPTVKQALDKLLRLKKIERIGLGRSARYRKL